MMYHSGEVPIHSGGPRGRRDMSPTSPFAYSPQPQDLSTPTSPVNLQTMDCPPGSPFKIEGIHYPPSPVIKREPTLTKMEMGGRFSPTASPMKFEAHSPLMKFESPSPSSFAPTGVYSVRNNYRGIRGMDWQPVSPSPCSTDSFSPLSPMSNGGNANSTAVSSPMTSPLSPSSTATLSPSTKSGHDDQLSPAPSVTVDTDRKIKKSSNRQSSEECLVCGDRSSGYHYNALTCEGCKGFFRRSVTKKNVYYCKFGNNCEIDMYMRRKCQECRFKKCLRVGMRADCVVPEHACQIKRDQKKQREKEKKKDQHSVVSPQEFTQASRTPDTPQTLVYKNPMQPMLTKEDEKCINLLCFHQDRYETPSEDRIRKTREKELEATNDLSRYGQMTEMTRITCELTVEFLKKVPGFVDLHKNDQVVLIKGCTAEIACLRAARKYDKESDSIYFADDTPVTREHYSNANMTPTTTEAIFDFCYKMACMEVDNAEYALLAAITTFSERPHLLEPQKIEKLQLAYVQTLRNYVNHKWYPKTVTMFAKLLDVLTQLRTVGIKLHEQCQELINKNLDFPDLLTEIWEIKR